MRTVRIGFYDEAHKLIEERTEEWDGKTFHNVKCPPGTVTALSVDEDGNTASTGGYGPLGDVSLGPSPMSVQNAFRADAPLPQSALDAVAYVNSKDERITQLESEVALYRAAIEKAVDELVQQDYYAARDVLKDALKGMSADD